MSIVFFKKVYQAGHTIGTGSDELHAGPFSPVPLIGGQQC
jgi:hypothetical protein